MNMMSTLTIATWLEGQLGTIRLLITVLWSISLTSILYIIVAALLYYSCGWVDLMNQHSLGFSGVIFHLSVLESNLGTRSSRSVFGIFEVPAHIYPWAL
jgi:membrane associated rhomboid family serine protease